VRPSVPYLIVSGAAFLADCNKKNISFSWHIKPFSHAESMHRSSISVIVLINFILAASAGRHQRGNANDVSCDECGGQYFPSQEDSSTFISPDHEVKRSLLQKEIAKTAPNTLHIYVRTSAQLRAALLAAAPGHVIHVAPGKYAGQTRFTLQNKRGLPGRPIIITGPPSAIIAEASPSWAVFSDQKSRQANTSASNRSRYQRYDEDYYGQAALTLRNVSHVKVYGLTLTGSRLGVVLRGANDCLVQGVRVQRIQSSGIACERCTRVTITKCTLDQVWRGKRTHLHEIWHGLSMGSGPPPQSFARFMLPLFAFSRLLCCLPPTYTQQTSHACR
jgi:hypothetical protein